MPFSAEIHADVAGPGRGVGGGGGDGEGAGDFGEELLGGVAVEVFDDAVVGHDLELARWEEDGEEPVGVGGGLAFCAKLQADAGGAGGAVVAIGDVGDGERGEFFDEHGDDGGIMDGPDGVLDAVGGGEVVGGRLGFFVANDAVYLRAVAVGEEDGAGVCAQGADEAGAVVLFVLPGALVFFDDVFGEGILGAFVDIVIHMADGGKAGLGVRAHALLVKIDGGRGFAAECAVELEALEVFARAPIDGVGVRIGVGREFEFGAVHAEEGVRFPLGESAGFVGIEDIVGHAGDVGDLSRIGHEALESTDAEHKAARGSGRRAEGQAG